MPEEFKVEIRSETRGTVVTVRGELDVASSVSLEHELAQLDDVDLVVIDLSEISFIDSTGLGVLVRTHQRAVERGGRVGFVRGNGQVSRLLNLTGLDEQLVMADSPGELLAS